MTKTQSRPPERLYPLGDNAQLGFDVRKSASGEISVDVALLQTRVENRFLFGRQVKTVSSALTSLKGFPDKPAAWAYVNDLLERFDSWRTQRQGMRLLLTEKIVCMINEDDQNQRQVGGTATLGRTFGT